MEDSGVMRSLRSLDAAGKVDVKRALVLRTASNYAMQPDGVTAAEFYFGDRAPSGALDEGASPFEVCAESCPLCLLVFFLAMCVPSLSWQTIGFFQSKEGNSNKARRFPLAQASLESAWVLANTVAEELVRGWDDEQYATAPPSL